MHMIQIERILVRRCGINCNTHIHLIYLPVPPSVPNNALVLTSCTLVKSDDSGMAVAIVLCVR